MFTSSATFSAADATLFTTGGTVLQSHVNMTGGGTRAGTEINTDALSAIVSWITTVYWRGGKPRTYLPPPAIADTTGSYHWSPTYLAALQTAGGNFLTAVNALTAGGITGTQLGFVSFSSGGVTRTPPVFFPFTGATTHPRMGTQRRRLGAWTK